MITPSEPAIHATSLALQDILNQPEHVSLRRLTTLVEHLFRVRVAYMALLDHSCAVATRIGSGAEYWTLLKTYPFAGLVAVPAVVKDTASDLPPAPTSATFALQPRLPCAPARGWSWASW